VVLTPTQCWRNVGVVLAKNSVLNPILCRSSVGVNPLKEKRKEPKEKRKHYYCSIMNNFYFTIGP